MVIEPRDLVDHFLSEGWSTFTVDDAARVLCVSSHNAVRATLMRLQKRREVISAAKGLYVAVPPEYRSWGVTPGDWFIDALMNHLGRPYYVALLSAARLHGAAHQAPQTFQVMTSPGSIRDRDLGRVRLRFYASEHIAEDATTKLVVPTGYVTVSAKETTVVDLITYSRASGGLDNVATILRELGQLSGAELARVASRRGRAIVRRTGWFAERFGTVDELEALRQAARLDLGEPSPLDPGGPRRGKTDHEWKLRLNTEVEPDL